MHSGILLALALLAAPADFPDFKAQELDPHVGNVCYAVTVADVNGDGKPDVVALTEDAVVFFLAPKWEKQVVLKGATAKDNVCIQPNDIDGDGRVDFALGASWQPANTQSGGTLQWIGRDKEGEWQVHPIDSEPTLHRVRWGDVTGDGKKELVVAPLQGRGTKGPDWGAGQGVRLKVYSVPDDPTKPDWPFEVADDTLHTIHNVWIDDLDGDGRNEILAAAWEGVYVLKRTADGKWSKLRIGTGNQEAGPNRGSSEIKLGRLASGKRYIATIEPWHGFQAVVYTPPESGMGLWERRVIDEPLQWGHAVWCADLDGDKDEELIIGQRDPNKPGTDNPRGPGVRVYDPKADDIGNLAFTRHVIDDGGVAVEDAVAADLDGDGRPDLVAGGRATHNVKVYWNRPAE